TMTLRGLPIREDLRQHQLGKWRDEFGRIMQLGRDLKGPEFNLNSELQLARALESDGIKVRWNRTTGKPKMDGRVVERLVREHPEHPRLGLVGRLRASEKEVGAYEAMAPAPWDGRWHPSWKVHGTVTGRWSSTPNAQNLSHEQRCVIG